MLAASPCLPRLPRLPGVVLVALVALTVRIRAQDTTALRRAIAAVPPGAPVRVELRSANRLIAPIVGTMSDGFALRDTAGRSRPVLYQDVTRFWVRRRAIGAGAVTGGVLGTGFGVLVGLLGAGLCEAGDCPSLAEGAAVGGLALGAMGAGAGAIIGAAIPRWSLRWSSTDRPRPGPRVTTVAMPGPGENAEVERRRIGELNVSLAGGYGGFPPAVQGTARRGAHAGGVASYAFRTGRVGFGPEVSMLFGEQRVWTLGGVARVDLAGFRPGRAVPFATAGLGLALWTWENFESNLLTLTLGAGVTLDGRWRLEGRWQPAVQNITIPRPTLVTIAAGHRFVW